MRYAWLFVAAMLAGGHAWAQGGSPAMPPAPEVASVAERVYAAAKPRLLQIRTLVAAADRQSSIGSGFLVSADGLAVTNYHVVSQYALEPATYRLEYGAADQSHGEVKLLAIDVANDLALVRVDRHDQPSFGFDDRALHDEVPKGERLYSMGNPLDLGFTIVEGTYNGLVDRSYNERIHFSGAINPGMSGGPTVTADGHVVGINVSKQLGGELVSFLVPARFAAKLLASAQGDGLPTSHELRAEIGRQLTVWQDGLYKSLSDSGFRDAAFGPYKAPESATPWFTCWAQTNAGQVPKPRASNNTTSCSSDTQVFVAADLTTGGVRLSHSYLSSIDLNQFQFATFVSQQNQLPWLAGFAWNRKWHTQQRCHEDFLAGSAADERPSLRAVWCARAYREFEGLYDVWVMTITQDRGTEALVSRLSLQGVSYPNAIALGKRFIEAVQWKK
ncbi:MAG TPA: S1C family serine protease [Stellaceae bacterium]|nr:S1C family serine protease [Stellaceae bacterium]